MISDLRYAIRMLLRSPGFATVAVLTLALGIGSTVTIFSVIDAVLLRPLPFADAGRLVFLWSAAPAQNIRERASAHANVMDWRAQSESFENIAVFDTTYVTLSGADEPQQVVSVRASVNLFQTLGVGPALGRTFTADEERQKARVVIIGHGVWQRQFNGAAEVLGRTILLDGVASVVIGVMPEGFAFPGGAAQLWEPIPELGSEAMRRGTGSWRAVARIKPDVSFDAAQAEMNAIANRLEQSYPEANRGLHVRLVPLRTQITGRDVQLALWMLFAAVILVLLIACTNVANLMLARGVARERELAIRMAVGAGRWRLIRERLTECGILALLGGAVGLLAARSGLWALIHLSPPNIPGLNRAAIDARVLLFTLGISVLTALLFGLIPALKTSAVHSMAALKEGRSAGGGVRGRRIRGLMVVTEFGLAVLLLAGAGLLMRSFINLQAVDPGFDPSRVLVIQASTARSSTSDQWRGFYQQALERIAALPGVEAAGLINDLFTTGNPDGQITLEQPSADGSPSVRIPFTRDPVSEDFFRAMRVPLVQGRYFSSADDERSIPVAIINETMARRLWPGEQAVGKRFKPGMPDSSNPWLTVVGVVGDMRRQSLEREPYAQLFRPFRQDPNRAMNLVIRTTADPANLAAAVREQIRTVDPTIPLQRVATLEDQLENSTAQRRFQTWLLSLFSGLALLLAAVGIYGLIHQSVAVRTREIGTRMALGARRTDVFRLVLGEGIRLAMLGIGIGLLAAFALTRVMTGLLFDVSATDTTTFIAAPSVLMLVALLACYIPARRAARVDPMVALRSD